MPDVVYEVVEHTAAGPTGWSETFPTHEDATAAAKRAAREQEVPGESATIEYQDEKGRWRTENTGGRDRPDTEVEDHGT